jgi:hypothetical protein
MKTAEEIRANIREDFSADLGKFHSCAFFDDRLDCIRVIGSDCSVTETRVNGLITVLEANYPPEGRRKCVGFTIKGARHFCKEHNLNLTTPIKISDLLDAILIAMPNVVVETFIDCLARPLVTEQKIEQVEPATVSGVLPQEA